MAHRLRLLCVIAVSVLTSVALAQAQSTNSEDLGVASGLASGSYRSMAAASAYPGQASGRAYTYAKTPQQDTGGQQQANGGQAQSQSGNQNPGMNGNQNQTQNQNQNKQGQGKEEAPPEKPHYLTYTPKKKSLQEEAKSGKALAVEFKSVPAGARVTVDGYFLGKTPMTSQIPLGKHLVSITKWGYRSWEQELDVANGKTLSVNPTLQKDW